MFTHISHAGGVEPQEEILFSTRFGYLFPDAAGSPDCLLEPTTQTILGLVALGDRMADPGTPSDPQAGEFDSQIPAIFTYLGQFIDHDLTARTDRDGSLTAIGMDALVAPLPPVQVVSGLRNGRRPHLDLDSVYGDGPSLVAGAPAKADPLYTNDLRLLTFEQGGRFDLPRATDRHAVIADARNDENLVIGQLHNAFLRFHNAAMAVAQGTDAQRFVRARQLTRWAYQFVVVEEYLPAVCDPDVVADVLANGPRAIGPTAGTGEVFVPLEFSVAAFRFGHSMIRPFYRLNGTTIQLPIMDLLGTAGDPAKFDGGQLSADFVIDWTNFVPGGQAQMARILDPKIAQGLFDLRVLGEGREDMVLRHLARSNLMRGFNLSIPHGQAMASAYGLEPLPAIEILGGEDAATQDVLQTAGFDTRTPLWFYVLKEAQVHQGGQRLGALGSRIVAETIVALVKQDPNSYLNNRQDPAVRANAIDVEPGVGGRVSDITDFLRFAGLHP